MDLGMTLHNQYHKYGDGTGWHTLVERDGTAFVWIDWAMEDEDYRMGFFAGDEMIVLEGHPDNVDTPNSWNPPKAWCWV
jgi:hypothetical protein